MCRAFKLLSEIKMYKSIIKENMNKHHEIMLLEKTKLDTIEFLISKALIDLCISHDEFVAVNSLYKRWNKMREEIKNPETSVKYTI